MNEPTPLTPESVDALLERGARRRLRGCRARSRSRPRRGARATRRNTRSRCSPQRDDASSRSHCVSTPSRDSGRGSPDRGRAGRRRAHLGAERARSRRDRNWRLLVAAGSVAAAIVVIVGIASLANTSTSDSKASSAAAPTTLSPRSANAESGGVTTKSPRLPVDFGDVTHSSSLREPAKQLLTQAAAATQKDAVATSTPVPGVSVPNSDTATASGAAFGTSFAGVDAPACSPARLRSYNVPAPPALDRERHGEGCSGRDPDLRRERQPLRIRDPGARLLAGATAAVGLTSLATSC